MDGQMKTPKLLIEFDWLDRQTGSEIDRAFFADLGLAIGDEFLTRIDDLRAKTVRNRMRGCAYRLATWLAANWWRLRWEPEPTKKDADWRLAHTIAAAGGGYVWPNATFASDGVFLEVTASPRKTNVAFEPIRYIASVHTQILADEFERKVDQFMEAVLSRLQSCKLKDEGLRALWSEVLAERRDPEAYRGRKLEAMAGYDPDEAPEELVKKLIEDRAHLGKSAVEEVAAEARHSVDAELKTILKLVPSRTGPQAGGYRASIPVSDVKLEPGADTGFPWQKGARLARRAREVFGLGKGRVSSTKLADLLGASPRMLKDRTVVPTQMPIAFRGEKDRAFDIYFDRPRSTTRRFALSRVLGDYLYFGNEERLIPATHAKTSRQKFQRSFAQEFLCPIDALLGKIQTREPNDDDIAEAAEYFGVSPMMITTTLVNHGKLEREALASVE